MAGNAFDIYQTAKGYTAVTNAVRRQIVAALAEKDLELGDLVEITGKAKPTLSSVHMTRLVSDGLVKVQPHPSDSRRKVYTLAAKRIGASDVPVDTLREAVKEYVERSPLAARFPLRYSLESLAAAPRGTDPAVLRAQAANLGRRVGTVLKGAEGGGDALMRIARFLEQEGVARPLRLDLEAGILDLAFGEALPETADEEPLSHLMAGFVLGVAQAAGQAVESAEMTRKEGARACQIRLPELANHS